MILITATLIMALKLEKVPLQVVPVKMNVTRSTPVSLGVDQTMLAGTNNFVFEWNFQGKLLRTIPVKGEVIYCKALKDFYIVTVAHQDEPQTLYFDSRGNPLTMDPGSRELVIYDLMQVDDMLFAPNLDTEHVKRNNNVYLANQVLFLLGPKGLKVHRPGHAFLKANQRMHELFFNFKKVFLVRAHNSPDQNAEIMVSMNQLENRVYRHDAHSIEREQIEGQRVATSVPYFPVNLKHYHSPPRKFFTPKVAIGPETTKVRASFKRWWNSLGLIRLFDKIPSGYVIVYEVPIFKDEICTGYELLTQLLDQKFKTTGAPFKVKGNPVGLTSRQKTLNLATFDSDSSGRQPVLSFYPLSKAEN